MAISFLQYKTDLENAWKAVCDVKNDINWAVFGYEGKKYELKVVDQGEDGIEEMVDSLSGSKVQYAFLQIIDPNTSLPKLVLINWSGEGAPVSMKGTCARHVPDVAKLLRGAHVTINARTDDDVEEDVILKKVASSSGSNYSFHKETASVADQAPAGPVGSVYKRTNAAAEIKAKRSDNFWNQHDEDDKRRKQEETKKRQQESEKEEAQRRKSEDQAAQARDKQMSERMQGVTQNKLQEKRRVEAEREAEQRRWEEQQNQQDSPKRNQEAAEKRKEAAALVSQRQSNPRDYFENKSREVAAPPPPGYKPPITLPKADEPEPEEEPEPEPAYQPEPEPPARNPMASALAAPPAPYSRDSDEEEAPADDEWADDGQAAEPEPVAADQYEPEATYDEAASPAVPEPTEEPLYESADGSAPEPSGGGISATAIYDYQAGDDTEITFDPGDIITEIEEIDSGWWQGRAPDGSFGMFPSNYVERIE